MTSKLFTALTVAIATLMGASTASATIFTKDYHKAGVWNSYDDTTQTYSMKFTDGGSKDGFWLVVSPGDNPKKHANEYAILYGDRAANRITAYAYDGKNSSGSYKNGSYLGTYENAFSDGGKHSKYGQMTMFSLDVSTLNSAYQNDDWQGVRFGDEQGIWFHQSSGSNFAYDDAGRISDYTIGGQMWLDTANKHTNSNRTCGSHNTNAYYCKPGTSIKNHSSSGGGAVPAPGGLALILLGLAGFGLRRRA